MLYAALAALTARVLTRSPQPRLRAITAVNNIFRVRLLRKRIPTGNKSANTSRFVRIRLALFVV